LEPNVWAASCGYLPEIQSVSMLGLRRDGTNGCIRRERGPSEERGIRYDLSYQLLDLLLDGDNLRLLEWFGTVT
jgi:hypothetical protein